MTPDYRHIEPVGEMKMSGAIAFILFLGAFFGLAVGLLFGLRAVKLI